MLSKRRKLQSLATIAGTNFLAVFAWGLTEKNRNYPEYFGAIFSIILVFLDEGRIFAGIRFHSISVKFCMIVF